MNTTQITTPNETDIVVTRAFNAPRGLVWRMWTEAQHLQKWWGPKGWTLPVCEMDFRVGGTWRYMMRSPEGQEAWGLMRYTEIAQPERFAANDYFTDAEGQPVPDAPVGTITVAFAEQDGGTLVTNTTRYPSKADRDAVIEMGMEAGTREMFDRFAAQLALQQLERLVGTWRVSGGAEGEVRYEWLEGGHFLMQHVSLAQHGQQQRGIEMIGYENTFHGEQSADIQARYYDNHGNTFDYVYEIAGDMLTIWGGARDSEAYYRGTFSADGTLITGAWTYPGGGGYETIMTKLD